MCVKRVHLIGIEFFIKKIADKKNYKTKKYFSDRLIHRIFFF